MKIDANTKYHGIPRNPHSIYRYYDDDDVDGGEDDPGDMRWCRRGGTVDNVVMLDVSTQFVPENWNQIRNMIKQCKEQVLSSHIPVLQCKCNSMNHL